MSFVTKNLIPSDISKIFNSAIYSLPAMGDYHGSVMTSTGTLVGWGDSSHSANIPPTLTTNKAVQVKGGAYSSFALLDNGTTMDWGEYSGSAIGQSGLFTFGISSPATARSNIKDIGLASYSLGVLKDNGSVITWDPFNSTVASSVPSAVQSDVKVIDFLYTLPGPANLFYALKTNGSVVAWGGSNNFGELTLPSQVSSGVVDIAACFGGGVALKSDGTVVGWGRMAGASLGTGVVSIAGATNFVVGLKSDGTVVVWGVSYYGNNPYGELSPPNTVLSGVLQISARNNQGLALKIDGSLVAWGRNDTGQRDVTSLTQKQYYSASHTFKLKPRSLRRHYATKNTISIAGGQAVAIKSDGSPIAWGRYYTAQIRVALPTDNVSDLISIMAYRGGLGGIALKSNGSVIVWGEVPTPPTEAQTGVISVALGSGYGLALKDNGSVIAWGQIYGFGEVNAVIGSQASSLSSGIVSISAHTTHFLVLRDNGSVIGFGDNQQGQTTIPTGSKNATSGVIQIAAGNRYSLALKADGTIVGWGDNSYKQLNVPTQASSGVIAIAAGGADTISYAGPLAGGSAHSLALKSDGSVIGWGDNRYGQVNIPTQALSGVIAIDIGYANSLALKSDGSLIAWGADTYNNGAFDEALFLNSVPTF